MQSEESFISVAQTVQEPSEVPLAYEKIPLINCLLHKSLFLVFSWEFEFVSLRLYSSLFHLIL